MLTLQEVKQKVAIPEGRESLPTAKHLRDRDVIFISRSMGADAEIMVYQSGYAVYRIGRYATVFSVHACGDYQYPVAGEILYIQENFFNLQEWYVRLVLEGEDRIFRNREAQEQEKSISYSAIAEDCMFMDGLEKSPLEQVIRQETIRELLEPLTERQRLIIGQYFFDRKAQKEIAHELGTTAPLVSKTITQAIRKMQKGYAKPPSNIKKEEVRIEKGGKSCAW